MTPMPWWRSAVVYQIYPRSFGDSDGDGIGDIPGVIAHLDYLANLGVDALWLSPFYRSPMADHGYDVSGYTEVDPIFGTIDDFDHLLAAAHEHSLRVIIDWVPNHTSNQHPWFLDSRSSRTSAHRDWYVWRDSAPDGGPPNNWQSQFPRVGSGWTFDGSTGQWYLHSYLSAQPDLDWGNPAVVEAMSDVLRFWLRRGVDGFRIDVPQRLGKDDRFRDNPGLANEPLEVFAGRRYDEDQPVTHDRLRTIRSVVDEFEERLIVGEVYVLNQKRMAAYVNSGDELHLAHNFTFLRLPWEAGAFRRTLVEFESVLDPAAWAAWCLGNHDHSRIASRFGSDGQGAKRAKLVGLMLLTLRGTPFLYFGDELALPDSAVPDDLVTDIHDRDRVRGPMPWLPPSRGGDAAGFSQGTPWLPVAADAETLNVASQTADRASTLSAYRELLRLRRATPALRDGEVQYLDGDADILAYRRWVSAESWFVLINFSSEPRPVEALGPLPERVRLVFSTDPGRQIGDIAEGELVLGSLEGIIINTPNHDRWVSVP